MDADGLFAGIFNNNFHEDLLILVHKVARRNHNAIRNYGIYCYLDN